MQLASFTGIAAISTGRGQNCVIVERNSFRFPHRERNEFRSTMRQFGPRAGYVRRGSS